MNLLSVDYFKSVWSLTPQLTSIVITTIFVCWVSVSYSKKIAKIKPNEKIGGWLALVNYLVTVVENQIISSVGRRKLYLTPYIMYIYAYIIVSCIFAVLGFESLTTSFTVTLAMAFVTFFMIYGYGIKYQKIFFFKRFLNPSELISQFVPLISLSFRLFGNMVAGSIMLTLLYSLTIGINGAIVTGRSINDIKSDIWNLSGNTPYAEYKYAWTGFDVVSLVIFPFLHIYFDLFDGSLQALVFANLTLSYWSEQMHEDNSEPDHEKKTRRKKINKKNKEKKLKI